MNRLAVTHRRDCRAAQSVVQAPELKEEEGILLSEADEIAATHSERSNLASGATNGTWNLDLSLASLLALSEMAQTKCRIVEGHPWV